MIPLLLEQEPKIPLNEGCLIIEVHDYRPPNHSQLDLVDKRKLGSNIYARNPFKNSRASQWGAGFGPSSSMPGVMGTASSSTAAGIASGSNGIIQPAQSSVSGETGEPSYIKNRIMMKPDSESLYETLLATHQSWNRDAAKNSHPPLEWDDNSILELEARILVSSRDASSKLRGQADVPHLGCYRTSPQSRHLLLINPCRESFIDPDRSNSPSHVSRWVLYTASTKEGACLRQSNHQG
jgi:hypothetical protein